MTDIWFPCKQADYEDHTFAGCLRCQVIEGPEGFTADDLASLRLVGGGGLDGGEPPQWRDYRWVSDWRPA